MKEESTAALPTIDENEQNRSSFVVRGPSIVWFALPTNTCSKVGAKINAVLPPRLLSGVNNNEQTFDLICTRTSRLYLSKTSPACPT